MELLAIGPSGAAAQKPPINAISAKRDHLTDQPTTETTDPYATDIADYKVACMQLKSQS